MAGDGELGTAQKLIQDLQIEVASLKERIQVLELENAKLSTSFSKTHKMYGKDAATQVLQHGGFVPPSAWQSRETMLMEKKMEADILGPSQCNPSFPSTFYAEDNDHVIIQGSSFGGTPKPGSPSKYKMSAGNKTINVTSNMQASEARQQGSILDQVNMESQPLTDPDIVRGQTEAEYSPVEHSGGFRGVSDIPVDQKRKKKKEKKKTDENDSQWVHFGIWQVVRDGIVYFYLDKSHGKKTSQMKATKVSRAPNVTEILSTISCGAGSSRLFCESNVHYCCPLTMRVNPLYGRLQSVSHCARRYVALKIMYFGQRFYGFSSEAKTDPTVESEIFAALEKTRLLIGTPKEAHYSRCGRTDKGVSAIGQVIALYLRSNHNDLVKGTDSNHMPHEKTSDEKEIDYVKVLNRALPSDIRVIGWCPVPEDFHARFSCLSREYKYFFLRNNLDISGMEVACEKFVGDHDFRNFCKMDARNVHNYRRRITAFEIVPCGESWVGKEILAMQIKGSAFLWHQVRCMAAVLFMVGHGMESPTVIDDLLDTSKTVRKPQYNMASELPLILESCEFEGLSFRCSSDAATSLHSHMESQLHTYLLGAVIFHAALCQLPPYGSTLTFQPGKKKSLHVPLTFRPTEPTYEERKVKFSTKLDPISND